MTAYDPNIHTQIHPAHVKPVHTGWYPATVSTMGVIDSELVCKLQEGFDGTVRTGSIYWWYWDGAWRTHPNFPPTPRQNRIWFGLREKP